MIYLLTDRYITKFAHQLGKTCHASSLSSIKVGVLLKKQKPAPVSKADNFQMTMDYLVENDNLTITMNDLYVM